MLQVVLDGLVLYVQYFANLPILVSLHHQCQDFKLSMRNTHALRLGCPFVARVDINLEL